MDAIRKKMQSLKAEITELTDRQDIQHTVQHTVSADQQARHAAHFQS